ncbi:hypothetical protein GLAREA_05966 [Glarea lozoyensis ATCC 20868]|uniref:Uncharacterized protein n=1 Tax=Glarea lozoyensis (strain ATCC 20868 / MF5171) TaxID=1116229 RepID=S3D725_GLAL2|nr:uncharacterized protein GLAREA_05966 [Glarea lozoyensis ATCC 20868]EPE32954.1 hypothetical protein GLAREA_05966 [Glarea lozoyensis ATCC 20868]
MLCGFHTEDRDEEELHNSGWNQPFIGVRCKKKRLRRKEIEKTHGRQPFYTWTIKIANFRSEYTMPEERLKNETSSSEEENSSEEDVGNSAKKQQGEGRHRRRKGPDEWCKA